MTRSRYSGGATGDITVVVPDEPTATWDEDADADDLAVVQVELPTSATTSDHPELLAQLDQRAEVGDAWTADVDATWAEDATSDDELHLDADLAQQANADDSATVDADLAQQVTAGDDPTVQPELTQRATAGDHALLHLTGLLGPDTNPAQLVECIQTAQATPDTVLSLTGTTSTFRSATALGAQAQRAYLAVDLTDWAGWVPDPDVAEPILVRFALGTSTMLSAATAAIAYAWGIGTQPVDEDTTTWNNQPTVAGLGAGDATTTRSIPAGSTAAPFQLALSPAQAADALGGWLLIQFTNADTVARPTCTLVNRRATANAPQLDVFAARPEA